MRFDAHDRQNTTCPIILTDQYLNTAYFEDNRFFLFASENGFRMNPQL